MKELKVSLSGKQAMLQHSARMSNPMNPIVKDLKAITSKRKKTDSDLQEMSRLEFIGSIYADKDGDVILPAEMFYSCVWNGAKLNKNGQMIKRGVFINEDSKMKHSNDKLSIDEMFANGDNVDIRSVKVGQARVMRTRPIIHDWSANFTVQYDENVITDDILKESITNAGALCGVGDYRPTYGRFSVEFE